MMFTIVTNKSTNMSFEKLFNMIDNSEYNYQDYHKKVIQQAIELVGSWSIGKKQFNKFFTALDISPFFFSDEFKQFLITAIENSGFCDVETKNDKAEQIYLLINQYHDPNLIDLAEISNSNHIYHIYSDGEITSQKGGCLYGQRREITLESSFTINLDRGRFPEQTENELYGFAIVTRENASEIREAMRKLIGNEK